ncbi:hypothetical protein KC327_g772 [Hortaea werneckii]|uniref:Rhodopsin domain-containing protein n=1 Tax=Hortaea werneckii EXF-2000 TaxID=1157616 RepID=A0A1Z5TKB6_HORWE|nr:hypothetical protein KC358_g1254 [Hortaea werneckii]OTA36448.1 hypothetical protein BTJ68_03919 [Hortaea werneckii EXF-2000]KAI6950270.1 hypothetical protein KC348_g795 [Hortaea werneckii]KAI6981494.1 hypothetical protein KC321_g1198 [Hortaea werneckii]KAI7046903.1 hypothetical protein KC362_g2273 [Hortaea werneckii]
MRFPPLEVLSTWPTPNYDNPETRGEASLIVNIIFLFLVLVAVALRVYSRTSVRRWFGLDDIMIGLATLFTIGLTVVVVLANERYGWNRHIYDIPFERIEAANIIALTAKCTFTMAATFTRLSLCMFYYRLVGDSGVNWFRWVVHANVAFTIAVCITFVFLSVFLCTPVQYYWEFPPSTDGHCLEEGIATLAAGILNLSADLLATITPIPLVMRLNMRLKYKIGVSILFGLGFIVIVAGIVRTYYIWKGLMDTYDATWYAYPLWIAAAVEIDVGVICACAPALKTLFHFSSSNTQGYYSREPSGPNSQQAAKESNTTSSKPSSKRSFFNATAKLPWSHNSRSQKGSVRIPEPDTTGSTGSWLDMAKSRTEVICEPATPQRGGRTAPALEIMRRDSVELESLCYARTVSSVSHHEPSYFPDERHLAPSEQGFAKRY